MIDDPFIAAHRAAAAHIEALDDHMLANDPEPDPEKWSPSPALTDAPYCGCSECELREGLAAAWPLLRQAALDGWTADRTPPER